MSAPPQLHTPIQLWSCIAPKNQNGEGHNASLDALKRYSTNQWYEVMMAMSTCCIQLRETLLCAQVVM